MNIIVIGSEGFIGSNLVDFFIKKGHNLTGIDSATPKNQVSYRYIRVLSFNYNLDDLIGSFIPDVLIFAGGSASVQLSLEQPYLDFEANVLSVSKLLESLKKINTSCKFIHFSSAAIYGNPINLPIKESDIISPLSPYGWHKYQSEVLCKEYHVCYNIPTCSLRPFSVYGPGQKKMLFWDLYQKVTNSSHNIELFGTGDETRDFIFIDDLLDVVDLILNNGDFKGESYNIASGTESKIRDVAMLFVQELNKNLILNFNNLKRDGDPLNWKADVSKIEKLGFARKMNIDNGIKKYISWLKEKKY